MANRFLNNITINDEYTLPPTDGTANQVIKTDGAGNLSFVDATALVTTAESGLVYYDVKNSTGGAINKGKAVRAVGTDGNSGHILIDEMIADGSVESKYFMGILETTLNNGDIGRVIHFGEIDQFNTLGQNGETWNDGDLLWLDPSNNGDYTITEPNGPNIKVAAAIVVNAATNGKIFTRVQANEGVHDLHDVLIQSVATGHILVYDATTDVWKNSSQSTDAALMPSGTEAQRPTPTAGMIRFNTTANEFEGYNGTEWAPIGGTGSASIDIDNFTGNSSEVNFILSSEIQEEDNTQVYIDGVYQSKSNYTTSGTTLTFSTPPPTGTSIEVVNFTSIAESQIDGTGTTNYIAKWTDADTLANSVIQDDGTNVGIGCTPTSISGYTVLDINNSTNGAIIDLSQADAMKGRLIATSSSMAIETASGIPISFQPSGTERMRIASNGAVGINGDNYLYAFPSTSNTGFIGSGFSLNGASNSMQLWTNNTERLRITSSGNVGIGTTSPSFKLQVNGDFAAEDNIYLTDAGTVRGKFELNASDRDDVDIKAVSLGSNMKFFTVDSERMRIDSSGNVQIGSGTRFGKFDILNIGGSGSNFIIDAGGDNYYTSGASGVQVFRTGSTERMRIDSSGKVSVGAPIAGQLGVRGTTNDSTAYSFEAANSSGNSLFAVRNDGLAFFPYGNVGIGTTSPSQKLTVRDDSTSAYPITLENTNIGTPGVHTGIRFGYINNTYQKGAIIFEGQDSSGRGKMFFAMEANANSANADETDAKMTIDYSGNVGIGTTSPSHKLEVNTGAGIFSVRPKGGSSVAIASSSSLTYFGGTHEFYDTAGTTERMRIDSSGRVGMGTTSPLSKIHIENTSGNDGIRIINSTTGEGYIVFGDTADNNTGSIAYNHTSDAMTFDVNNAERMRIDSSGNVAINDSTNANISLTVTSKSGYEDIAYFKSSGTNIDARINLFPTGTGNGAINSASNSLELQTAGSPKMTIDSSGNVGIGTTSPATKLHISDAAVTLTTTSTNGVSGFIHNVIGGATALYRLQNNYSEVMRINPNGNVGIGTTSPSAKFHTNCSSYPETTEKLAQFNAGVANYQSNRYVELSNSFTGAGYTSPALVFKTNANSSNQKSYGLIATLADGSLSFQNKPAGSEIAIGTSLGTQEKMRITSSGDLHVEGDVIAASTTVSSDENLKKDISTYEDALQTISELNGVSFTWKSNDKKSVGVIAQDVQKVLPELVGTKKSLEGGEETLTVDYNGLIGVLIQAVKELSKQVEELKN